MIVGATGAGFTVSVAAALVAVPAVFVTTTLNVDRCPWSPLLASCSSCSGSRDVRPVHLPLIARAVPSLPLPPRMSPFVPLLPSGSQVAS